MENLTPGGATVYECLYERLNVFDCVSWLDVVLTTFDQKQAMREATLKHHNRGEEEIDVFCDLVLMARN